MSLDSVKVLISYKLFKMSIEYKAIIHRDIYPNVDAVFVIILSVLFPNFTIEFIEYVKQIVQNAIKTKR